MYENENKNSLNIKHEHTLREKIMFIQQNRLVLFKEFFLMNKIVAKLTKYFFLAQPNVWLKKKYKFAVILHMVV